VAGYFFAFLFTSSPKTKKDDQIPQNASPI